MVKLVAQWCERVLGVGCATGSVGRLLKESRAAVSVTGVEIDPTMAERARCHLDAVVAFATTRGAFGGSKLDPVAIPSELAKCSEHPNTSRVVGIILQARLDGR